MGFFKRAIRRTLKREGSSTSTATISSTQTASITVANQQQQQQIPAQPHGQSSPIYETGIRHVNASSSNLSTSSTLHEDGRTRETPPRPARRFPDAETEQRGVNSFDAFLSHGRDHSADRAEKKREKKRRSGSSAVWGGGLLALRERDGSRTDRWAGGLGVYPRRTDGFGKLV